ncbi:DUF6378 domain-containing protein [Haloferax larsenii]|uniref:DUF6378 domain-containing protein n=1 Tax=Haloferax larsenii TaxID=302484 RepID=A0A1H7N9G6_HALLR|nr:DUF6378 domain-containing protein [Haloferax larsenii]SEL19941.1 hypothetical protein SAMN04488691_103228 [Haloferax larsenii]
MSVKDNSNVQAAGNLAAEVGNTIADRNGTHGDPVENHDHIADLWNAYLGVREGSRPDNNVLNRPLRGDEVADMMILLKLSRKHVGGMDLDHYRDSIGYAAIASLYVPEGRDNAAEARTEGGTNPAYEEARYKEEAE